MQPLIDEIQRNIRSDCLGWFIDCPHSAELIIFAQIYRRSTEINR